MFQLVVLTCGLGNGGEAEQVPAHSCPSRCKGIYSRTGLSMWETAGRTRLCLQSARTGNVLK